MPQVPAIFMESEMRSAICAIALLVGIATATPATADDDPDAMALGVGAELGGCGDWLKERPGSRVDIAVRQWILGFFQRRECRRGLARPWRHKSRDPQAL